MTIQRILLITLFFMMATMQLGASCSETTVVQERPRRGYDRPVVVEQAPPPPVYVQQPGPVIVEEPPPVVIRPGSPWPRNAQIVAQGQGGQSFRADRDGVAYIVDAGLNRCVASVALRRGETITVQPRQDRILVDNRTVDKENLRGEALFQILFAPYGGRGGGPGGPGGPPPGRGGGGAGGPPPGRGDGGPGGPPPIDTTPGWPNSAVRVADSDNHLAWRATGNGTVYIIDAGQNRLITHFEVRRGQNIEVEPGNDRVLLDNRTVDHQNLRREARHQILFDANGGGGNPGRGAGGGGGGIDTTPGWPNSAAKVADGQDRITWKATADGTVYIVDAGVNKLLSHFEVRRNQTIVIEPRQDKVLVDNRDVYSGNLRGEARHQIYFDKK